MGKAKSSSRDFYGYLRNYRPFTDEQIRELGIRIDETGKDASALEIQIKTARPDYSPLGYTSPPVKAISVARFLRDISKGIKMSERNYGEDAGTLRLKSRLNSLDRRLGDVVQKFASNNMNLIVKYAKRYAFGLGIDVEDVESLFDESVNRAIYHFDFSRGCKFSTFAVHTMRRDLKKYLDKECTRKNHFIQTGEENIIEEINSDGRITPDKEFLLREGGERLKEEIERAVGELNPREALVLKHRFLDKTCLTLDQTGQLMDVTKERVRQVQITALVKLREILEKQGMRYIAEALG